MLRPASRQISTRRVAPLTSVSPHALKKSLLPPNVPVPRLNAGTLNPDPPSSLNSIAVIPRVAYGPYLSEQDTRHSFRSATRSRYVGRINPHQQIGKPNSPSKVQRWKH